MGIANRTSYHFDIIWLMALWRNFASLVMEKTSDAWCCCLPNLFSLDPLSYCTASFPFRFALSPELSIHPSLSPLLYIYVFSRQYSRGNAFNSVCVCVCVKHFFFSQFWSLVGLFLDSKYIPSVVCTPDTLTRLLLRLHDFVTWCSTVLANCFQESSNLCFFQECVCVCTRTHYK